jgi:voltage-gated potassium channel
VLRSFPQWRFLQLTAYMALWMLLSPRIEHRWIVLLLMQVLLLNSLLVTLWANPGRRGVRSVVLVLWAVSLLTSTLAALPLPPELRAASRTAGIAANVPVLVTCVVGFLMFVFRSRRLTADGLFATVASYLLISFIFAQVYLLVLGWAPDSFQLPVPADQRTPQALQSDMVYFSLITLATVGYGDILPKADITRTLAVIEAVIGQFYVAVIVAVFVGMYASQSREPPDRPAG